MRRAILTLMFAPVLIVSVGALESWARRPGCGGNRADSGSAGDGTGSLAGHARGSGSCGGRAMRGGPVADGAGACLRKGDTASMSEARDTFHGLLRNHDKIDRTVQEIDGGVATTTVSDDPAVTEKIRKHVRQMQERVENGDGFRYWDPLFVEIFEHDDEIAIEIEDVPGGVKVKETSMNPEVVKLIRAHAKTVTEFTERGFGRAHETSPLPEGYVAAPSKTAQAPFAPSN